MAKLVVDNRDEYDIVEVDRDGNCLFSTILDLFSKNLEVFKGAPKVVNEIRQQSVEYIVADWDRFFPVIKTNLGSIVDGFSRTGSTRKQVDNDKKIYTKYMTTNGKYGTFTELLAAAELYGFNGYIFQLSDLQCYVYDFGLTDDPVEDDKKTKLQLLFTGHAHRGHFRSLCSTTASVIEPGIYDVAAKKPTIKIVKVRSK